MNKKAVLRLVVACLFALAGGFGFTAWAQSKNWCETCHLDCQENYRTCMASGHYTAAQCAEFRRGCVRFNCDNCIIP